jgi:uncharacterized surface protein with fasciclin (FAS1) repeats
MKVQLLTTENLMKQMRISFIAMMMVAISAMTFAQSTVVDVVVNSKDHSTLEAAVIAAELADDLSGEGPYTLFAPTDDAFAALPEGTVASLLEDPTGELANILLYHVVKGKALSSDLSNGETIATLNGDHVEVKISNGKAYIDNAQVTIADIKADNGVVHVINAVMIPSSKMAYNGKSEVAQSGSACGK